MMTSLPSFVENIVFLKTLMTININETNKRTRINYIIVKDVDVD